MTKLKVALLVNQVAPNRVRLYQHLAAEFDLSILHGRLEGNRTSWREVRVPGARDCLVKGWQFALPRRHSGQLFDHWFLHLEPGYVSELIRTRPDVVISLEMGFRTLAALSYGFLFRKPVWVWSGVTLHTERHAGILRRSVRAFMARCARNWISYGQTATEYLRSLDIPRENILQLQNNVDETWYAERSEPAFDVQPKPVLLHVGQLIARKGVSEFLHAIARLQRKGADFSTVFVGSGPDAGRLKDLAQQLLLRNVHFYPAQPAPTLPGFYQAADALVFPSLEDVWGLVANEALLSGLPVLCSRYAGCAAELFDKDSIFDPALPEDFDRALARTVAGQLPAPDPKRLKRTAEIAAALARAIQSQFRPASATAVESYDLS